MLKIAEYFDSWAETRDAWKRKNAYYYTYIENMCASLIPEGRSVLEIGCGTGDLLAAVRPQRGVGLDISQEMVKIARRKYPDHTFLVGDAENLPLSGKFDYIIMDCLLGHLNDAGAALQEPRKVAGPETRLILTFYNFLWEPILRLGEKLALKMPQQSQNWLGMADVKNLLFLTDWEVEREGSWLLLPKGVPFVSDWVNRLLPQRPFFKELCLMQYIVARPQTQARETRELTCSVIIPCRNEVGNIEDCVERVPDMGKHTELIFVDGNSTDGTRQKIEEMIETYKGQKDIKLILQVPDTDVQKERHDAVSPDMMLPLGKGDAVRKGFAAASGEVLMILDADLTVPPEELPKFFLPLAQGKTEFVNGSRLVYPLENEAMKPLNLLGNKIFSIIFTWLLGQRIKDTLCGTKVLLKEEYGKIEAGRSYFGDFDPFGDFDLLFGAARQGLRIVEMPVRYRRRVTGESKVRVFQHGWLLIRMCVFGFRRFKLAEWRRKLGFSRRDENGRKR